MEDDDLIVLCLFLSDLRACLEEANSPAINGNLIEILTTCEKQVSVLIDIENDSIH